LPRHVFNMSRNDKRKSITYTVNTVGISERKFLDVSLQLNTK